MRFPVRRPALPLQSFRLKNFKSVRDSGVVKFTPLTAFIGNNGSGKSSLIEGLETFQTILMDGLDTAMQQWHGFEHIWNQYPKRKLLQPAEERSRFTEPMRFELRGMVEPRYRELRAYHAMMEINAGPNNSGEDEIFIQQEQGSLKGEIEYVRNSAGVTDIVEGTEPGWELPYSFLADHSSLTGMLRSSVPKWQFLSLVPQAMSLPVPQKRTGGQILLAKDGSNLAEYLLNIRRFDRENGTTVIDGIVETLQYVLPYARDVQPALTSELERSVYLQLTESDFKLPGWLLSTGTLRILALLAVLRHPTPPPLLVVEEIENGLDPRTINLVVEEIRSVVESGSIQVIITTHSPYLLDLLTLSQIIVVERDEKGSPVFTRPADHESLQKWSEKFSPGQLYTMSKLGGRKSS